MLHFHAFGVQHVLIKSPLTGLRIQSYVMLVNKQTSDYISIYQINLF